MKLYLTFLFLLSGCSGFTEGSPFGQAAQFNGLNQYIDFSHTTFSFPSNFTFEAWITIQNLPIGKADIFTQITAGGANYEFYVDNLMRPAFSYPTGTCAGPTTQIDVNHTLTVNTKYHVAVDNFGGHINFYVNGSVYNSGGAPLQTGCATSAARMAAQGGASAQFFSGVIDELRISSVNRYSAMDFNLLGLTYGFDSNTLMLMHFDDGRSSGALIPGAGTDLSLVNYTAPVPFTFVTSPFP